MTAREILKQLQPLGKASYKKVMLNHGVREPIIGVKIEELKKFQKLIKKDYQLALDLYDTGVYDAQYLAGLIADEARMTKKDFRRWLATANCATLCGTTVPSVAAESPHGYELAMEWIDCTDENTAQAGWATLSGWVSVKDDAELNLADLRRLVQRIGRGIHQQPNNVRYVMNGFLIAVGSYVCSLTDLAIQTAEKIGVVSVDMGKTACQVPSALDYIRKIQERGTIGKKRKAARC
jgi:3-methyladenine DNA glycosylase AlkD